LELRSYDRAALRDVCLRTHLQRDGSARVEVLAEVENFSGADLPLHVEVSLSRGAQPLYDVTAVLSAEGRELDRHAFRYGLRQVALLREPLPGDEGTSFVIAVNGERVFCKGANWVPADSIIARVTPAKYRALIGAAAEANINMLRIWGGGIFEDDAFYQLCDEHGILVWHDFLYACAYYPDEDACIALWCGNNENQWIHAQRAEAGRGAERCLGERIYDEVLPQVCAHLDPTRPYWPSSPYGGETATATTGLSASRPPRSRSVSITGSTHATAPSS